MPPGEVAKVIASQEPRRKEESAASTFVMIMDGLGSKLDKAYCPRCGWNSDDGFDGIATYHKPLPEIPPRRPHETPRGTQPFAGKSKLLIPAPASVIPEADRTDAPRQYVPDPDAIKKLADARGVDDGLPGTWYEGPDDFDPEKET